MVRITLLLLLLLFISTHLHSQITPRIYKVLAVMVEFEEDDDPFTSGNGKFDMSTTSRKIINPPPHDKNYFELHLQFLRNYFYKISRGNIIIEYHIIDHIFTLPNKMSFYSPPPDTGKPDKLLKLVYDTWSIVDTSSYKPPEPIENYDCYIIFHAGVGRDINMSEILGYDPTPFDIPSIFIDEDMLREFLLENDIDPAKFKVKNSIILPETESRVIPTLTGEELLELGMNGLIVANFASFLGLPDLFDTNTGRTRIGRFGLMDPAGIFAYQGLIPPEPSAWEKVMLGIVNPVEIKPGYSKIEAFVNQLDSTGDRSVFKLPVNAKEYFLIENRMRDANGDSLRLKVYYNGQIEEIVYAGDTAGFNYFEIDSLYGVIVDVDEFDWALPGSGILIWHINENIIEENIRTNSINNDLKNRGVELIEADGSQDIGQIYSPIHPGSGSEYGTQFDMWYPDNPAPLYRNEFSDRTFPPGMTTNYSRTHFRIFNFGSPAPVVSFEVILGDTFISPLVNFPVRIEIDKSSFITVGNIDKFAGNDIVVNSGGKIYAFNLSGDGVIVNSNLLYVDRAGDFPPAIFDFDFDGAGEVVSVDGNKIYAFRSVDTDGDGFADSLWVFRNEHRITTPPVIFRAGNIVIGDDSGYLIFLNSDGALIQDGRIKLADDPISSIVISDNLWFAFAGRRGFMAGMRGWEFDEVIISAAGGDMDGDGNIDIVAIGDKGGVFIINPEKNIVKRSPVSIGAGVETYPVIADVNLDGYRDVIITAGGAIWGFNHNGAVLDNFPIKVTGADRISFPVIANIDDDQFPEIIVGTDLGQVWAYDGDGNLTDGFPLSISSSAISSPVVYYEEGFIYLIVPGVDGYLHAWRINSPDGDVKWSGFLADSRHSNFASAPVDVSPEPIDKPYLLDRSRVYNWPNPVYDNVTFIRFFVTKDAKVNIKIFDLSGSIVDEISVYADGGIESEVEWDVSSVQSGIYYARVEAVADGRSDVKVIKIAVVK